MHYLEKVLSKYNVRRIKSFYPYIYESKADKQDFESLCDDLKEYGFKFQKSFASSPSASAVEAVGVYRSIEYILDIILHGNELKVEVYY